MTGQLHLHSASNCEHMARNYRPIRMADEDRMIVKLRGRANYGRRRESRGLLAGALILLAFGGIIMFGNPAARAAVLSVGSAYPAPFGGNVCADVNGGSLGGILDEPVKI